MLPLEALNAFKFMLPSMLAQLPAGRSCLIYSLGRKAAAPSPYLSRNWCLCKSLECTFPPLPKLLPRKAWEWGEGGHLW